MNTKGVDLKSEKSLQSSVKNQYGKPWNFHGYNSIRTESQRTSFPVGSKMYLNKRKGEYRQIPTNKTLQRLFFFHEISLKKFQFRSKSKNLWLILNKFGLHMGSDRRTGSLF